MIIQDYYYKKSPDQDNINQAANVIERIISRTDEITVKELKEGEIVTRKTMRKSAKSKK